jgi:hypothetical protein
VKRVYLGGDWTTTRYYKGILAKYEPTHLRAFLSPDEIEDMNADMKDEQNLAYWTPRAVAPERLVHGRYSEQDYDTLTSVFSVVVLHYPEDDRPDVDEAIRRHAEAIRRGITTHKGGQKAEKPGSRAYQIPDEGYVSD